MSRRLVRVETPFTEECERTDSALVEGGTLLFASARQASGIASSSTVAASARQRMATA